MTEALQLKVENLGWEISRLDAENKKLRDQHPDRATLVDVERELEQARGDVAKLTEEAKAYEKQLSEARHAMDLAEKRSAEAEGLVTEANRRAVDAEELVTEAEKRGGEAEGVATEAGDCPARRSPSIDRRSHELGGHSRQYGGGVR